MDGLQVVEKLKAAMPEAVHGTGEFARQHWIETRDNRAKGVLRFLRDDPELAFDALMDLTAVDYLNQGMPERFGVVYILYSFKHGGYFRVKAWVPESDPKIDSVHDLWKSAPWAEREVYDMFGIVFRGHPDLRRIQLPEYYTGHPLRKDYPLRGMGERDTFPRYVREEGA
ncbi:MAG: NADH-quinone oxidoreductase subunit C [Planctomycetes bacterium]|nr:NADH-quinone oxidoreductase subunit C [Planctomycetota bacterium]